MFCSQTIKYFFQVLTAYVEGFVLKEPRGERRKNNFARLFGRRPGDWLRYLSGQVKSRFLDSHPREPRAQRGRGRRREGRDFPSPPFLHFLASSLSLPLPTPSLLEALGFRGCLIPDKTAKERLKSKTPR